MRLYLKQKVFSWKNRFSVKDESGNDVYTVEGEFFSWGKKLHIYDRNGVEAAFIRQKVFSLLPRYYVEINGRVICEIVKEFTLFRQSYRLEGLSWHIDGNIWAHEYMVSDGVRDIMQLTKKWFTWGDSYELDIADPKDELLCLCVALAIDCALESESASSGGGHNH